MSDTQISETLCINCGSEIEENGGLSFRCCHHCICLNCLTELSSHATRATIRCVTNSQTGPIIVCKGFLNLSDLEWIIPEEAFKAYKARLENKSLVHEELGQNQIPPTNSTQLQTEDNEVGITDGLTFEELDLTEEELQSGWGQIASSIFELEQSGLSFDEANSQMDLIPLWTTTISPVSCPICLENDLDTGIILKGCFHIFCKDCLSNHITHCKSSEVQCPFRQDEYVCNSVLKPKEVENLVPRPVYLQHYETISLEEVEKVCPDTFHCLSPNCPGFCFIDQTGAGAVIFHCPKCGGRNCTRCKVQHAGSCETYQRLIREEEQRRQELQMDARNRITQRENERLSEAMISNNITQRNFMRCPRCNIPCYKFTGCNHVVCGSCRFKFDWAGREPSQFR